MTSATTYTALRFYRYQATKAMFSVSISWQKRIPTCRSCAIASTCCLKLLRKTMRVPRWTTLPMMHNSSLTGKYFTFSLLFQSSSRMHRLTSDSSISRCHGFGGSCLSYKCTYSSAKFLIPLTCWLLQQLNQDKASAMFSLPGVIVFNGIIKFLHA